MGSYRRQSYFKGYFEHPLAQRPNPPYFGFNGDVDAS
jgi:hypothetical protein